MNLNQSLLNFYSTEFICYKPANGSYRTTILKDSPIQFILIISAIQLFVSCLVSIIRLGLIRLLYLERYLFELKNVAFSDDSNIK